ncbi:MAG: hypothetical protein ABS84_17790 [Rubrivivax sp. SCN 71-131]|jgi:cytochrome c|nr:MAG: hypothetical protein ABS84_17790 [Rubrivivax sp. SCN 71-131]
MKLKSFVWSLAFVAVAAVAQERGTKEEAVAMADAAVAHAKSVGPDQAFKDFTDKGNATWHKKDLYVFVNGHDGMTKAHGANDKLVGKNMLALKDQDGKPFIQEMGDLSKKSGSGWVEYEWAHPQTKKAEGKATYVKKLSNFDGYVGVGIYR